MNRISLLTLFIFLYLSGQIHAQAVQESMEFTMDTVFKKYNHLKGPGAAVAIIQDGKIIFKKSYGLASLENNQLITSASVFDIASLSKQFTGFAISTLIQEGKISITDNIRKYLPWVPNFGKVITIDELLYHSSGLRDYPDALMAAGWRYSELATLDDVTQLVKHQKELDFVPGTEQSYSNTGYVLLAAIVEKVSGEPFPKWMDERMFKPLKMTSSFVIDDSGRIIPGLATSYYTTDQGYAKYTDRLTAYGSGSIYSSLDDLIKWVIHFQEMLRQKNPVYLRMINKGTLANGEKLPYGFGLDIGEDHGLPTISHTGAWVGYRTNIRNYPEQHFALITLSNADDNELTGTYAGQIVPLFLKDHFKTNEIAILKAKPTLELPANILKKYTGDWQLSPPANKVFTFVIDSGHLVCRVGTFSSKLEAKSTNTFLIPTDNSAITFTTASLLNYHSATFSIAGKKTEKQQKSLNFSPDKEQLKKYTGTYYSSELQTFYKIRVENGKLFVYHFRRGDFEITPVSKQPNEFMGSIGKINFYFNPHQKVTGFKLSGDRMRNVRFEKHSF
ncbi:serine hydrolase [Pedobacter sp. PAMC26386]|nr:serine hydrolase [Pedobacter sp. PAMC26386]